MAKDYYNILGVEKTSSGAEIKKAYRKMAHKFHPDKGGGKESEEKFKEINEAYQVLSDPAKKQRYDQFGQTNFNPGGGGGYNGGFAGGYGPFSGGVNYDFGEDLGDIFDSFFGGGGRRGRSGREINRGRDIRLRLEIELRDVVAGKSIELSYDSRVGCASCAGSGAKDNDLKVCATCGGSGRVEQIQRTIIGSIRQSRVCSECQGQGKVPKTVCEKCTGQGWLAKTVTETVEVPAGVEDGMTLRAQGKGEAGTKDGETGDLLVEIRVKPDSYFQRDGRDVYTENMVSFPQAALGDECEIETLDGSYKLRIPAGTQNGKRFRLKGVGFPVLGNSVRRGDQVVTITVAVPTKLTAKEKESLQEYAAIRQEKYSEEGVIDSLKRKMGL